MARLSATDDRTERRGYDEDLHSLGAQAPHGGIGLRTETPRRLDQVVIEFGEKIVHVLLGHAFERREHLAPHPSFALRKAKLVRRRPREDLRYDSLAQHVELAQMANKNHRGIALDGCAVEIECGDLVYGFFGHGPRPFVSRCSFKMTERELYHAIILTAEKSAACVSGRIRRFATVDYSSPPSPSNCAS